MIDHVSIAVRDLESATRFYQNALAPLGYTLRETRANAVAFGKDIPSSGSTGATIWRRSPAATVATSRCAHPPPMP